MATGREGTAGRVASAMGEADYLAAMVQNLGVAARLDIVEPRLDRAEVRLDDLMRRVVSRHRTMAEEHEVELVSAVPDVAVTAFVDLTRPVIAGPRGRASV